MIALILNLQRLRCVNTDSTLFLLIHVQNVKIFWIRSLGFYAAFGNSDEIFPCISLNIEVIKQNFFDNLKIYKLFEILAFFAIFEDRYWKKEKCFIEIWIEFDDLIDILIFSSLQILEILSSHSFDFAIRPVQIKRWWWIFWNKEFELIVIQNRK